jgi:hypothetical protein
MEKQKQEPRYMELDVPGEAMSEIAEIIEASQIDASILGLGNEEETIAIGFDYSSEQRESMMEIIELIEDYNSPDDNEEEEEEPGED